MELRFTSQHSPVTVTDFGEAMWEYELPYEFVLIALNIEGLGDGERNAGEGGRLSKDKA